MIKRRTFSYGMICTGFPNADTNEIRVDDPLCTDLHWWDRDRFFEATWRSDDYYTVSSLMDMYHD